MDDTLQAREWLQQAEALVIGAGAGMGVDSGLPDFRGNEGFWRAYPPMRDLGVSFSDMANPRWFERDPDLAWGFYGHRLNLYRQTEPHAGFARLLEFGDSLPQKYFVFTSNVDGQFHKAGFAPQRIVEAHGSIHHLQCSRPCSRDIWSAENTHIEVDEASFRVRSGEPVCPYCGALARPNILMFGDWAWLPERTEEQERHFQSWLNGLTPGRLVVLEFGAGGAVPTVRMQSESLAARLGRLIRVNPRESEVPKGHVGLAMGALDAVHKLLPR
jgi:NAD-dependent SIR2 family protein deacetylase